MPHAAQSILPSVAMRSALFVEGPFSWDSMNSDIARGTTVCRLLSANKTDVLAVPLSNETHTTARPVWRNEN